MSESPRLDDVARLQWENYIESRVNHLHDAKVTTPSHKRARRGEEQIQRHEDGLLLYLKTHGH